MVGKNKNKRKLTISAVSMKLASGVVVGALVP